MSVRKLWVFKHDSELGNAPANKLFDSITIKRKDETKPARAFSDYKIEKVGEMPKGVEIEELL